jgi:hypothetical protein
MSERVNWDGRIFGKGLEIIAHQGYERGFRMAVEALYESQLTSWPELGAAVAAFSKLRTRDLALDGRLLRLQNNPARIKNVNAVSSPEEIAKRPCPLCPHNMPPEQRALPFLDDWMVVCNPLPLFKQHFVLVGRSHTPQRARSIIPAMLEFTRLTGYTTLYNGPRCGASIPDHMHLQACPPEWLPLSSQLPSMQGWDTYVDRKLPYRIFLAAEDKVQAEVLFDRTLRALEPFKIYADDYEPGMNIAVAAADWERPPLVVVHPRARHRPECFYAEGEARRIVSPGAADMAGLVILPRAVDFEKLDQKDMHGIFEEVCLAADALAAVEKKL